MSRPDAGLGGNPRSRRVFCPRFRHLDVSLRSSRRIFSVRRCVCVCDEPVFSVSLTCRAGRRSPVASALCGRPSPHTSPRRLAPRAAATSRVSRGACRRGVVQGTRQRACARGSWRHGRAGVDPAPGSCWLHGRVRFLSGVHDVTDAPHTKCLRCVCGVSVLPHARTGRGAPAADASLPLPVASVPRLTGTCPLGSAATRGFPNTGAWKLSPFAGVASRFVLKPE